MLQSESKFYTFEHIRHIADEYSSINKGIPVWFYSDSSIDELAHILALWWKGAVLVPVSRCWSSTIIQRLLDKTGAISWTDCINHYSKSPQYPELSAFIQTSGTDSFPKIVPITKAMQMAATETTAHFFTIQKGDSWLLNLPIHHIGGLSILLRAFHLGYSVFISEHGQKQVFKALIKNGNVQFASLVPTQLKQLVDEQIKPHSRFKQLLLGGGPVSKFVLQAALDLGFSVVNSFGMTETAAQFTGKKYKPGDQINSVSVGKPINSNTFKITDENPPYEPKEEGLLWISGPQVFSSYLSGEDFLTHEAWFCTGDFARLNSDGELEIEMRRTDRIVSGGENINPIEVEKILETYDEIKEALVTGKSDEVWGEKLVCLYTGDIKDESKLKSWLKERLEPYKIPKEFIRLNQLPRISISKLDRKAAKKMAEHLGK